MNMECQMTEDCQMTNDEWPGISLRAIRHSSFVIFYKPTD